MFKVESIAGGDFFQVSTFFHLYYIDIVMLSLLYVWAKLIHIHCEWSHCHHLIHVISIFYHWPSGVVVTCTKRRQSHINIKLWN